MATPVRELILDNIYTVLNTISIANGYKTDVTSVERTLVPWPVTIVGHVSVVAGELKTQALAKIEDDIIAVINADTTRDGNAIRTNWKGTQTDEGNTDSNDHRGGSGTLVMAFDILYQRSVNST